MALRPLFCLYFSGRLIQVYLYTNIFQADLDSSLELGIHLENFPKCRELHIPAGTENYKVKLRLYDNKERLLELNVRILARYGAALRVSMQASI